MIKNKNDDDNRALEFTVGPKEDSDIIDCEGTGKDLVIIGAYIKNE